MSKFLKITILVFAVVFFGSALVANANCINYAPTWQPATPTWQKDSQTFFFTQSYGWPSFPAGGNPQNVDQTTFTCEPITTNGGTCQAPGYFIGVNTNTTCPSPTATFTSPAAKIDKNAPTCGTWSSTGPTFTLTNSTDSESGINTAGGSCTVTSPATTCTVTISDKVGRETICTSPTYYNGLCSNPDNHLNPCQTGTSSSITPGSSGWTWSCIGSNGGATDSCSETTSPSISVQTSGSNCAFSPTSRTVASGDTAPFTVTANTGYTISSVSGCGGTTLTNPVSPVSYTTGAINATCTVSAVCSAGSNNCVGGWGACVNGTQTCSISQPASGNGTPCPCTNGATQACQTIGVSGTLSVPNCTIASGASSCTSTATWSVSNSPSGSNTAVTSSYPNANTQVGTGNSGNVSVTIPYNSRSFYLYNSSQTQPLDQDTASATCTSGTTWDGAKCAPTVVSVDGVCAGDHYICSAGTSTNNQAYSSEYTWNCVGTNGGATVSCSEPRTITRHVSTSGANCNFSPTSKNVPNAGSTSFTITPSPGYSLDSASGCGGNLSGNTYHIGPVYSICTIYGVCSAIPTYPDITAVAATPSTVEGGTAQIFSAVISNIGVASTGASFPYFFQVASEPGGAGTITDKASSTMSTLASGGSSTATSPSITFALGATPSVRVCADKTNSAGGGVISESNEDNNCGPWTNVSTATWSAWSDWSDCSVTACGTTGIQTRTRTCLPVGADCGGLGSPIETKPCSAPACAATIKASPTTIVSGDSTVLTWNSNLASCTGSSVPEIHGFNTNNLASGSATVRPPSTTTYTITCDDQTASVKVTVKKKPIFEEN